MAEDLFEIVRFSSDALNLGTGVGRLISTVLPNRQCSVQITNECSASQFILRNPRVHIDTGVCAEPLTMIIPPSSSGDGLFTKSRTSMRGTGGVFTYDLCENLTCKGKVAALFKVPYDRNLRASVFAVGFFDPDTKCDKRLFHRMFKTEEDEFVRAAVTGSCITFESDFVTIAAVMSNSDKPILKIEVRAESRDQGSVHRIF